MSRLVVSPAPHIRGGSTTTGIMRDVLIALLPAGVASVLIFGLRALLVIAVCTVSAVIFEWLYEKLMKRTNTVGDLSACVTGVLLAYNLPVTIPLWQAVLGSGIAIILVKQLFGGIGKNFANPAITSRIFLLLAFSGTMANWVTPDGLRAGMGVVDGITSATPLPMLMSGEALDTMTLFLGNHGGSLGEVSALALLIGFAYLLIRRVISWELPTVYVGVVFLLSAVAGHNPVNAILTGGLLIGAIFMATDYVTSPLTFKGRVVFGVGAGALTVLIREYGSYPEGVSYAILLMNILTPYINKFTKRTPMGAIVTKRRSPSPVIVLVLICVVIAGALAYTNEFTKPIILDAADSRSDEARIELLPEADGFDRLDAEMFGGNVYAAYTATNGAGSIFSVAASGYSGEGSIKIMVAISPDGSIAAIKTLANSETKGLGTRVSEPEFESQFIGRTLDNVESYDAISGATVSSKAYSGAVAEALAANAMLADGAVSFGEAEISAGSEIVEESDGGAENE